MIVGLRVMRTQWRSSVSSPAPITRPQISRRGSARVALQATKTLDKARDMALDKALDKTLNKAAVTRSACYWQR